MELTLFHYKFTRAYMSQESFIEDIPNTFMPDCRNKVLSIEGVLRAYRHGFVQWDNIPKEVQQRLHKEIERRLKQNEGTHI